MDTIRPVDAGTLLMRALRHAAAAAGCGIAIESLAARPWSSATFTGTRHHVVLTAAPSPALDAWIERLPEAELTMRGHLVADLVVDADVEEGGVRRLTIAVLTLAER